MLKIKHRTLPMVLVVLSGCASGPQLAKIEKNLTEESRRLTTAVVDTLQLQPSEERDIYSTTALQLAGQDQRIEGIALDPINVPVLLGVGEVTAAEQKRETGKLQKDFEQINRWLQKRESLQEDLLQEGLAAEAARQRRVRFWGKLIVAVSLPIAGVVALFVFVPAAIPIGGRVLGWLVSKVPSLAGAVGVVSVKAFDAVVRGIERTRASQTKQTSGVATTVPTSTLGNEGTGTSRRRAEGSTLEDWFSELELNLSRGMDQAHKALVQRRKLALKAA